MKKIYSVLVENRSGVLCKVAGLFSRRAFNIDSLVVGETDDMSPAGRQVHFKAMRKLAAEHPSEKVGEEIRKLYSWNGEDKLINN